MLNLLDKPMANITEPIVPCVEEQLASVCEPCRQVNSYLPRIVDANNKDISVIRALATAILRIDDELMNKICGVCFTADVDFITGEDNSDACECLLRYGASVGAPLSYVTIHPTNCMKFGYTQELESCTGQIQVFAYCQQLCEICDVHVLEVCNSKADFEFYKKIVKFKAKWFNAIPSRKNIVDALIDWFGSDAYVLDAHFPNIYWSLGRTATADELAIMPFVYSMIPVYDGINLIYTEELT